MYYDDDFEDADHRYIKRLPIEPFAAALGVSDHDLRRTLSVTKAPIPYRTRPGSGKGSRRFYDLIPALEWAERTIHGGLTAAQARKLTNAAMTFAEYAEVDAFNRELSQ